MEKHEIFHIIHSAIVEVSPSAAKLLEKKDGEGKQDIFFVDLGLNSIDYALIAHFVMEKLNVDHPLDIFTRTNRINDVVEIFYDLTMIEA